MTLPPSRIFTSRRPLSPLGQAGVPPSVSYRVAGENQMSAWDDLLEPAAGVLEAARFVERVRVGAMLSAVDSDVGDAILCAPLLDSREEGAPDTTAPEAFRHG